MRTSSARLLVCASIWLLAAEVRADWPVFGHDAQRSATTSATLDIGKPVTRWKTYIGGNIDWRQLISADIDGDGKIELFFVSGGRVVARSPDGVDLWTSAILDASYLNELVDLDGDMKPELVVHAGDRVVLLDPKTGLQRWDSRAWKGKGYDLGNVGAVRIADLTGDGVLDLLLCAGWGGGSSAGERRLGTAFDFHGAGGFDAPVVLFDHKDGASSERDYLTGYNDVLADIDGDGALEWIAFGLSHVYAYTTRAQASPALAAGELKLTSEDIGSIPYGGVSVDVADVDGDGKEDLVLYSNNAYNPSINSRRAMVVGFHQDMATMMSVFGAWWARGVANLSTDAHAYSSTSLRDVDKDGKLDVAVSFFDGANQRWVLKVYDALTGTEKLSVPDSGRLVGLVDLDDLGRTGVLTQAGADLRVYGFTAPASLTLLNTLPNTTLPLAYDRGRNRRRSAFDQPIRINACGDAQPELLVHQTNAAGQPTTLRAIQPLSGMACTREYALAAERFLPVFPLADGTVAAGRSSGYLTTLAVGDGLVPTNLGQGEIMLPGVRLGGYYGGAYGQHAFPIAPKVGNQTLLLSNESGGDLVALDVSQASVIKKPQRRWAAPGVIRASAFDVLGSTAPEILGFRGQNVVVLDGATGADVKVHAAVPTGRSPLTDILAAPLDGDAQADLVVLLNEVGTGTSELYALDAQSGAALWAQPHRDLWSGCIGPGLAVAPMSSGAPDIMTGSCGGVWAVAGATGVDHGSVTGFSAGVMMSADVDGDGTMERITTGAYQGMTVTRADLTDVWRNTTLDLMNAHFGAIVSCPGMGMRYGATVYLSPKFHLLDAATGARLLGDAGVVLAGGQIFPTLEAAVTAGKRPGVVGNVTGVANLGAPGGTAPAFLIGASDGFLYAIDACTGTLRWSYDLGSPPSQPIVADVRNDGVEQIVVSTADGYLRGIGDELFAAPAGVRDVDPSTGMPDTQVFQITTRDALYVAWDPVPGATSYECAVIDPNDEIITQGGGFVPCVTESPAVITPLPLQNGVVYRQAVRAIGPKGASVETLSPGVLVSFPTAMVDAGASDGPTMRMDESGCGCELGRGPRPGLATGVALLFFLVAARQLRRRRSQVDR